MERDFNELFDTSNKQEEGFLSHNLILNQKEHELNTRYNAILSTSSSNLADIHSFNNNIHTLATKEFDFKMYLGHIRKQLLLTNVEGPEFETMFSVYCDNMISAELKVDAGLVGLVVGPRGETIKRIQRETNTFIVTPSKNREPLFLIHGLLEDVEEAKELILTHIRHRTQNWIEENENQPRYSVQPLNDNFKLEMETFNRLPGHRWSQNRSDYELIKRQTSLEKRDSGLAISSTSGSKSSYSYTGYSEYEKPKLSFLNFSDKRPNNSVFESILEENVQNEEYNPIADFSLDSNDKECFSSSSLPTNEEIDILLAEMRSDTSFQRLNAHQKVSGLGRSMFRSTLDFCLLCFSPDIQYSFSPCGHSPFCKSCASLFLNKECLICLERVNEIQIIDVRMYKRTFY